MYTPKGYRGFESRPLRSLRLTDKSFVTNSNFGESMKKLLMFCLTLFLVLGAARMVLAQTPDSMAAVPEGATVVLDAAPATNDNPMLSDPNADVPLHQQLKTKFIEGGPSFMGVILLLLILGLAIVIERIIYLNLATTNTDKLLRKVEKALTEGGIEAAKEVCRKTRGPVASIFYQGLDRSSEGIDAVEKSVVSYGSVQMQQMESGLTWISLFIALAPMFGFMGTVLGMISAFDAIEIAGDIAPSLVAGGIKIALITTVFGLVVAATLQVFYNYILAKIDNIVMRMEDASISLIDILVRHKR